jgi:ubiquinone/menaquinone biosynthesis C-methylase UbiE
VDDDDPRFRTDLYRGTASFYDRFRLPYPDSLITDLVVRAGVTGDGRLLDLACGTGQVTFALCGRFAEVWAVDLEPETLAFARDKAVAAGVNNVRWIEGRAEDVDPSETFDLVTIGNAFHRLRRRRIAELARQWLPSGGHLAALGTQMPSDGSALWQRELAEIIQDWIARLDASDRLPPTWEQDMADHPNAQILDDAGLRFAGNYEFFVAHEWSVETLTGLLYSTSLLPLSVIGERRGDFEADLDARLLAIEPSGVFHQDVGFGYDLAIRP